MTTPAPSERAMPEPREVRPRWITDPHPRYIGRCLICGDPATEGPDKLGDTVQCYACLNEDLRVCVVELAALRQRAADLEMIVDVASKWRDAERSESWQSAQKLLQELRVLLNTRAARRALTGEKE